MNREESFRSLPAPHQKESPFKGSSSSYMDGSAWGVSGAYGMHQPPKFVADYFRQEPKFNHDKELPKAYPPDEDVFSHESDNGPIFNSSQKVRDDIKVQVVKCDFSKKQTEAQHDLQNYNPHLVTESNSQGELKDPQSLNFGLTKEESSERFRPSSEDGEPSLLDKLRE